MTSTGAVPDLTALLRRHDPEGQCTCDSHGDDRCEYRMLADLVEDELNPPDGDEAEVSLCMDAVTRIARFVRTLPCTCDPGAAAVSSYTLQVRRGTVEDDAAVRIEVAYNDVGLALERLDQAYAEAREKISCTMTPAPERP